MSSLLKVRPRSGQEIEKIAQEILNDYQPDVLKYVISFNVEAFFELELKNRTGVDPLYDCLPTGIDGFTDIENMQCVIATSLLEYGECQVTKRRLRSTQAHEIGHCILHVEDARRDKEFQQKFLHDKNCSLKRYKPDDLKVYENPEWQAWRFASALLMPEHCFRWAVDRNLTKQQIKRAFDVNPSFIDVRLRELQISKQLRRG